MMQRGQITVALAIVRYTVGFGVPLDTGSPRGQFIDCRVRACDVNDFRNRDSPEISRHPRPQAMPAVALPKTAVALSVYFATNSDRVAPKYYTDLNKLGQALTQVPVHCRNLGLYG